MSLILDTYETNTWISHISEDARKHLVINCPYLKINEKLRRTIDVADRKGVNVFVIYGKRELDEGTMAWLKGLRHSNIASIKDLHAKLYMNEEFAVISSMNLYEYSQVNNEELGVLCGRKEDRAEFKDITFQVMRLIGFDLHSDDTPIVRQPLLSAYTVLKRVFRMLSSIYKEVS